MKFLFPMAIIIGNPTADHSEYLPPIPSAKSKICFWDIPHLRAFSGAAVMAAI